MSQAGQVPERTVEAHVISLLCRLQRNHSLAYVFIFYDLRVVRVFFHRAIVLDKDRLTEKRPTDSVLCQPNRRPLVQAS